MLVYSFEVNGDSDASTPGTEDTGSFTVIRVYHTDEAFTVTGRHNHDPRTPTFPELKMLYPRKFHLPRGWEIETGALLAIACGIAALIALAILWCIGMFIAYLVSKLLGLFHRHPTLPPNSGPAVPMIIHGPPAASPALNLDGVDPPPGLVIGDGRDATAIEYFQLAPWINNLPQLAEDGVLSTSGVSPLLAEVPQAGAGAINSDSSVPQSKPIPEPAPPVPLASHAEGSQISNPRQLTEDGALLASEVSPLLAEHEAGTSNSKSFAQQSQPVPETPAEGSNVAKETLYGDGSDGPTHPT